MIFILSFVALAVPHSELLQDDRRFVGTPELGERFNQLNEALIKAPVL